MAMNGARLVERWVVSREVFVMWAALRKRSLLLFKIMEAKTARATYRRWRESVTMGLDAMSNVFSSVVI